MSAPVKRLEALLKEWQENADALDIGLPAGSFNQTVNLATRSALLDCIDDVREILREAYEQSIQDR